MPDGRAEPLFGPYELHIMKASNDFKPSLDLTFYQDPKTSIPINYFKDVTTIQPDRL